MKYIVICGAVLLVALYYIIAEVIWQLRYRFFRRRLIIAVLIMALLISQTGIVSIFVRADADKASAAEQETESGVEAEDTVETPNTEGKIITAFAELPDDVREQIVPVGTALEELILPDTLEAVCANADIDANTDEKTDTDTSDSQVGEGNIDQDKDDAEEVEPGEDTEQDKTPENPEENSEEEEPSGKEDDTEPEIPSEGESNSEPEMPSEENNRDTEFPSNEEHSTEAEKSSGTKDETVEAEPAADIAVQTETGSFVMPEYRIQPIIEIKTLEGDLPLEEASAESEELYSERLSENFEDEEDSDTFEEFRETFVIENITWQSEPEYDGDIEGEYVFTAVLPEGYELTEGVSIPEIKVTVGDIALLSGDIMPISITFDGGSGLSGSPWLISNLDTLQRFRDDVNNGTTYEGKYIKLTKDINLGASASSKWTRIGTWDRPFMGTFEGDGHTISGLYVDETSNDQGLFGCVKSGTIRDLSVDGYVHVPDSGNTVIYNAAGIVGVVIEGTIENCTNYATISGRDNVGGIVGEAGKNTKITNCTNKGTIEGSALVGGIVGKSNSHNASTGYDGTAGTISGCTNSAKVTAKYVHSGEDDHTGVGGIAGAIHDQGVIINCHNDGQVSGYVRAGGIVGYNLSTRTGTIKNCYNTGNVYGYNDGVSSSEGYEHGGIVGYGPNVAIEQCYNTGSVYGKDQIGGIAGKIDKNESYIKNSCNLGSVTAYGTDCGGIAGLTYNEVKITYCYSSGTLGGSGTKRGGIVGSCADGWVWMGNCYYLTGTASGECGTGNNYKSDGGEIKTMTKTELESGEFALYLQGKLGGSLVWVQNLKNVYGDGKPTSKGPIPTGDSNLKVLTVTFMKKGTGTSYNTTHAKRYTNPNFGVTMPTDLSPSDSKKYTVVWWTSTNAPASGTQFTADSTVKSDTTVYAYEQQMYAGESSTITKTLTYGDGLTLKLSDSMKYANDTSSANKFTYTIDSGNTTLKATTSGDTLTIPTTANVGTYTLKIIASEKSPQLTTYALGSYGTNDVTLTVEVRINKANSTVTTSPTANSLTYTGSAQALVKAGNGSGGTMQYSTTSSSSGFSTTIPTGTDAGSYTVWYKVAGDDNHIDTTAQSVTVTIEKATPSVTAPEANDLTYTGKPQGLVTAGTTTVGNLSYSLGESGTYTTSIPTGTDRGTYKVWYKVEGTKNYNSIDADFVEVTIKQAQAEVTAPEGNNLTYTGKEQKLVTAGTSTFGTLKYSSEQSGTYTTSIPMGTDAGSYTVWYKVDDDASGNYKGVAAQSATVKIAPAQAEVTAPEGNNLTYTGKEQKLVTAGTSTFGTLKYSPEKSGTYTTSIPMGTDAGSYTVWYKVDDDVNGNYKGVAAQSMTAQIAPAQAEVVTAPVGNNLTYTGKEQKLVTAGTSTFGTLSYSTERNGTYTDSIPTGVNAGSYTVWYKVNTANNYTGTSEKSVNVSIAKAAPTVTITAPNLTYTGRAQALIKTGRTSGGTLEYRLGDIQGDDQDGEQDDDQNGGQSNEWGTDIPTATEIGTYTVYYRVVGDTNYTDAAERYVTVKILASAPKDESNSGSGSSSGSGDSSSGQQTDNGSGGNNSSIDSSTGSEVPPTDSSGTESRIPDEDTLTEQPADSQNKKTTDPKLGDGTTNPKSEDRTTDSKSEETVQGTETPGGTGWGEMPDGKIVPAEVDKSGKIVANAETANAETGNADSNGTETDWTTGNGGAAIITGTVGASQSDITILTVGNGAVIVAVASDGFPSSAGVADTVAAVNTVLTPEQIQLVNSGEKIEIRVEVTDISAQISKEDKDIIENGLKESKTSGMAATDTDVQADGELIIGAYIDISVYIKIGDGDWDVITQVDEPIHVIIEIPDELKNDSRIYYMARSHEGAVVLLNDLDSKQDTITMKTELFSTYAIVYRQLIGADADEVNGFAASLSWIGVALWCLGILVILGITIFLILFVRRREEEVDS